MSKILNHTLDENSVNSASRTAGRIQGQGSGHGPARAALACTLALAALLAACSTASPDIIRREDAQRQSQIYDATVLSVRMVRIEGSQSGAGGVTGAVVGGLAGSSVGGGRGRDAATVLGAVAGAVAGNIAERSATGEDAVELLLQFANGERRVVVQAQGQEALQPGDAVIVIMTGGRSRVVRAPARGAAPAPAPSPAPAVRN